MSSADTSSRRSPASESNNSEGSQNSSDTDSDSQEMQLLARLRDRTRAAYQSEVSLKEKLSQYKNKVKTLKNQLSESGAPSSTSSRASQSSAPSSTTSQRRLSVRSATPRSPSICPPSECAPRESSIRSETKTESHRRYVRDLENYAKVRCSEADQILSYLRSGKPYTIEACFSSSESNELFTKMSQEIAELTAANRTLQAQLDEVCRLAETYSRDHARRKTKR
jgi:hypothetical protein